MSQAAAATDLTIERSSPGVNGLKRWPAGEDSRQS
jgi:hypothetical protein